MREIKYLVVHTTATPQTTTVQSIRNYWKNNLKWSNVGYHILIDASGTIHRLSELAKPTNGAAGFNSVSLHVSYIGGIDSKGKPIDNRTAAQKATMREVLIEWKRLFPNAKILGHRDLGAKKACPCFDCIPEYADIK
jgi:N-acetylmuramoyl-L-alanine amidase